MANFKTHMGAGGVLGVGFVVAGLIYSLFFGAEIAAWVFLAVLAGSFLPDLDLDDGIPFQIIFGLFGAGLAGLVFFNIFENGERDLKNIALVTGLIFVLVRFGAGYVFKKFTSHRGMFHSIPAALLFGLLTIWLLHFFSILKNYELIIGAAVSAGYFGHLVLDEIYSTVDFGGNSIFPKKSLGSALKLYSSLGLSNFIFYALIFILAFTLPETRYYFYVK